MSFTVRVTFNPRNFFAGLSPRLQVCMDGSVATHETREAAEGWARVCRQPTGGYPVHQYDVVESEGRG